MKELRTKQDIFDMPDSRKCAVCVTTNGIVKRNGEAVMGAGVAKVCRDRFPAVPNILGTWLNAHGNRAYNLGEWGNSCTTFLLFSFPTKHDWRNDSDPELIRKSCREVKELCDINDIDKCYLPRPGCTNGHLDYETQVRPILMEELDDRFIIILRD